MEKHKEKKPEIKRQAGSNWAVASLKGTLYETQSWVMDFLSGAQVPDPGSAKVVADGFEGGYTYVIFKAN